MSICKLRFSLRAFQFSGALFCASFAIAILSGLPIVCGQETESTASNQFSILAWNIETGGSEVATIKQQLEGLKPFDVLALSEVPKKAAAEFSMRWGPNTAVVGEKGGEACMLLAWDPSKFDKLQTQEITHINQQEFAPGIQFAPLVAELLHKPSDTKVLIVMNHLARGSEQLRNRQATMLVEWAKEQTLPIIAVGGYNFDYDIPTRKGNQAFDLFLNDQTWQWIQPNPMVDTNWADRNNDGKDDYPDSMLDFSFAAGAAKQWELKSEIIVREGDFPDNDQTSDQRPIRTTVHPVATATK